VTPAEVVADLPPIPDDVVDRVLALLADVAQAA
jgi:hypothetical protein